MEGSTAVQLVTLINFGIKSVLVLSFASLIGFLISHKSAAAQHAFWFIALSVATSAPMLYLILPKMDLACFPSAARPSGSLFGSSSASSTASVLLLIYMIGFGVVCFYLLMGRVYIHSIRRSAETFENESYLNQLSSLSSRMGISSEVALLKSDRIATPIAVSIFHPAVIMPADAANWRESVIHSALAHELAHIRRRDLLSRTVGFLCCAINWFNPLAWYALRRMMREQEFACDMQASRCFERPTVYAEGLLTAATASRSALAGAAIGMGTSSALMERLSEVLKPKREGRATRLKSLLIALFLAAVLLYPIAAFNFIAKRMEVTAKTAVEIAAANAQEEKARRDYFRRKGIEPDKIKILKKTEDSIYFSYTIPR
jgi:beta-lactamase regulating signal transducer with metallopeptidase domain